MHCLSSWEITYLFTSYELSSTRQIWWIPRFFRQDALSHRRSLLVILTRKLLTLSNQLWLRTLLNSLKSLFNQLNATYTFICFAFIYTPLTYIGRHLYFFTNLLNLSYNFCFSISDPSRLNKIYATENWSIIFEAFKKILRA